jgi:hypothetical protein
MRHRESISSYSVSHNLLSVYLWKQSPKAANALDADSITGITAA